VQRRERELQNVFGNHVVGPLPTKPLQHGRVGVLRKTLHVLVQGCVTRHHTVLPPRHMVASLDPEGGAGLTGDTEGAVLGVLHCVDGSSVRVRPPAGLAHVALVHHVRVWMGVHRTPREKKYPYALP